MSKFSKVFGDLVELQLSYVLASWGRGGTIKKTLNTLPKNLTIKNYTMRLRVCCILKKIVNLGARPDPHIYITIMVRSIDGSIEHRLRRFRSRSAK